MVCRSLMMPLNSALQTRSGRLRFNLALHQRILRYGQRSRSLHQSAGKAEAICGSNNISYEDKELTVTFTHDDNSESGHPTTLLLCTFGALDIDDGKAYELMYILDGEFQLDETTDGYRMKGGKDDNGIELNFTVAE